MRDKYADNARVAVELAERIASDSAGGYVCAEHILIGVLDSERSLAGIVLLALGVDLPTMRLAAEGAVGRDEARASRSIEYSVEAAAVRDAARAEADGAGEYFVGTHHLLMALTGEAAGRAAQILKESDVDLASVRQEVARVTNLYSGGSGAAGISAAARDSPQVGRAKAELAEVVAAKYAAIEIGDNEEALRLRAREKEIRYLIEGLRKEQR